MGKKITFEEITLRLVVSNGGGIEIDLTRKGFKGQKMSAYANYLGGGMLGKVCVNNTIEAFNRPCTDKQKAKLDKIGEELKRYYFECYHKQQSYEQNQTMPVSAY
jgi:hypothetical protein